LLITYLLLNYLLLTHLLTYLLISIKFSHGGGSPYSRAEKTDKTKYTNKNYLTTLLVPLIHEPGERDVWRRICFWLHGERKKSR